MSKQVPLVNKIIAKHAGFDRVSVGELVTVSVDKVYVQDGNSPTIARLYEKHNLNQVFSSKDIGFFFDHSVLVPNITMADRLIEGRNFAAKLNIQVFEQGQGISHVLAIEHGWFQPNNIVLGADSHTCIGGAIQSLALGMGASDIAAAMVTGKTWLKVPETLWITVQGTPHCHVRARDLIFHILAKYGQSPFLYKSIEWSGEWIENLSLDSACSLSSLGVELGAKCMFLPPNQTHNSLMSNIEVLYPEQEIVIHMQDIEPMVVLPHNPKNAVSLKQASGIKIDYVFIGSCTNSRLEDLADAAQILHGNKVHKNVHCVITPGSQGVYLKALKKGYIQSLVESGAIISPPGCGACVGTQGTIPARGTKVLSTMNRNFKGRMGNPDAAIYLSSPVIAAKTALLGRIPTLMELP
ncbi:3-isopropylmalate dehydratase large subunit [Bartonella senegalensis]|uniref:3-isopropylmalate dehydratase large subunit n=1 Tax=Bartonella senegalensis TaxID=1468418 RepID=UPI0002FFD59B|nr:aconitase/3-isopropylmalate dehydratase large subunit family protein [Bartonella senegalensis]